MKLAIILLTMGLIAVGPSCYAATDSPNSDGGKIQSSGDPIYMQYAGITGNSANGPACTGIQLYSFQWGVGRGISSPTGGSGDRESSAPSVSEIVVTKSTDVSSTKLLYESLQGTGQQVHIDFCKTERGKNTPYLQYDLTDTLISKFSISSGGDRPTESISLNFVKITMTDVPTGIAVSFDTSTNQATLITPNPTTTVS
jgi:type VI secretion system secreted protein Hcp